MYRIKPLIIMIAFLAGALGGLVPVSFLETTIAKAEEINRYSPAEGDEGVCPVMGKPASKEYSYTYQGKAYYFCCFACIDRFKENPQKYISKIKNIDFTASRFTFSPQFIIVKKDDIVKLLVTSRDVTHGISIKEYGINVSAENGKVKKIEFIADKTGEFEIVCSVYCGSGHSGMKAKLIVQE